MREHKTEGAFALLVLGDFSFQKGSVGGGNFLGVERCVHGKVVSRML
jgi:hypothetical protein